jgi:phage antirepressor YoqD-like protein
LRSYFENLFYERLKLSYNFINKRRPTLKNNNLRTLRNKYRPVAALKDKTVVKTFKTVRQAAKHYSIGTTTINISIRENKIVKKLNLYFKEIIPQSLTSRPIIAVPKSTTLKRKLFASIKQAAKYYDMSTRTILRSLNDNTVVQKLDILFLYDPVKMIQAKSETGAIQAKFYSIKEAADYYNISSKSVSRSINKRSQVKKLRSPFLKLVLVRMSLKKI